MNLDKAIKLLEVASHGWPVGSDKEDYFEALEMGRAALVRIRSQRQTQSLINLFPSVLNRLKGED